MQDIQTINEIDNNVNNLITESYNNNITIAVKKSAREKELDEARASVISIGAKTTEIVDEVVSVDNNDNDIESTVDVSLLPTKNSKPEANAAKIEVEKPISKEEAMRQSAYDLAMLDDAFVYSVLATEAKKLGCSKGVLEKMWKIEKKRLKPPSEKKEKKGVVLLKPTKGDVLQPNASIENQYTFHQDKSQFKNDVNNITYYWNNVYWEHFDLIKGQKHAYNWLKRHTDQYFATANKAKSCYETLQLDLEDLPATGQDIIVSVKNGWLKLNDDYQLEVMKPDRNYNIRSATKIALDLPESGIYEPKPVPENSDFHKYLNSSLPDLEDQQLLQEYAGYTFSSDKRFQHFILNIGGGGNGKGAMMHMLEKIHHNPKSAVLNTKDFDLQHLIHASIMMVGDASQETNVEMLKETTGGDTSMVRQKHKDTLSVELQAKWWINANEPPRWNDTTNAVWTRILPIKWEGKFREYGICNPALEANIIANELSIVLDWALEGLIRLYKRGGFLKTAKTNAIIEEMRGEQDNVRLFMIENEYQIDRSGCFLTKKQIYQAYQNWCNDHGNRPVSDVNFWKRLSIMFGNSLREERKRIGGDIPRLVNLKLPDDLKPEF